MGERVVHYVHDARRVYSGSVLPRTACGGHVPSELPKERKTRAGHEVTCRSCRHSYAWRHARQDATKLHDEVLRVLRRTRYDWGRNRERIANLFGGPLHPRPHVLVALDRYEETPPKERDPRALTMELAPVESGWLW